MFAFLKVYDILIIMDFTSKKNLKKGSVFMKRILSLVLVVIFALSIVSCKAENRQGYIIVVPKDADNYELGAAEYIKSEIKEIANLSLDIITDDKENTEKNEILIGNTNRELSKEIKKSQKDGFKFSFKASETAFAIEAESYVIAAAAYSFCENYVKKDFSLSLPMDEKTATPTYKEAKNVILLIGDGMGFNQTKLMEADIINAKTPEGKAMEPYFYGNLFEYKGNCSTDSLSGTTDSAAAATALSTGVLTTNGRIGRDKDAKDLETMTEYATKLGLPSAVMSTEAQYGATPAGFSAHADDRSDTRSIILTQEKLKNTIIDCDLQTIKGVDVAPSIKDNLKQLENDKGFFVMYEEAYIDKHCHSNNMVFAASAVARFNTAIGAFMEYAFYHPETVVIITADHETGGLNYENGKFEYTSVDHTSANVPVYAFGEGTEYFNKTTVKNIDISAFIRKTLAK